MNATVIDQSSGQSKILEDTNMIGRNSDCLIVVSDPQASRHHAMIRLHDDGYYFYDLGSFNGSSVNDVRVTSNRKLHDGDVIRIANCRLRYEHEALSTDGHEAAQFRTTAPLLQNDPVIVLVSDIFGYANLSERLPPDELAQVIGSWYRSCEQALVSRGATIDKYLGDAVLAYWTQTGATEKRAALLAAEALIDGCREINQARRKLFDRIGVEFRSGISLNVGEVTRGPLGAGEFSLIGDSVNVAFRIEALTRGLGSDVLVTADFLRGWEAGRALCSAKGSHQVKGRQEAVEVFSVDSFPVADG